MIWPFSKKEHSENAHQASTDCEARIKQWIECDSERMKALYVAASLGLPDWCLAAGFVRNLIWDKLHDFPSPTVLNDIDLIFFDLADLSEERDRQLEKALKENSALPWSVKNQARMHRRNNDNPYTSASDAMSYWVEVETAVGATLTSSGEVVLISPFGFDSLFNCTITLNPKRPKPDDFKARVASKQWLKIWPKLAINT